MNTAHHLGDSHRHIIGNLRLAREAVARNVPAHELTALSMVLAGAASPAAVARIAAYQKGPTMNTTTTMTETEEFLASRASWKAAGCPTEGHPYAESLKAAKAEREAREASPEPRWVAPLVTFGGAR